MYAIDLTRPMGDWKNAWKTAKELANRSAAQEKKPALSYRFYDLRHSFVMRLAENPNVAEQTITALAGHVSKRMLEHYSHIRVAAKRAAIQALESRNGSASPQIPPQSIHESAA